MNQNWKTIVLWGAAAALVLLLASPTALADADDCDQCYSNLDDDIICCLDEFDPQGECGHIEDAQERLACVNDEMAEFNDCMTWASQDFDDCWNTNDCDGQC